MYFAYLCSLMHTRDQALVIYFRLNLCQRVPLRSGAYAKLPKITVSDSKNTWAFEMRKVIGIVPHRYNCAEIPYAENKMLDGIYEVFKGLPSPWYLPIFLFLRYPHPLSSHPYCNAICVSPHSAKIINHLCLHLEANLCLREYLMSHIMMLSGL